MHGRRNGESEDYGRTDDLIIEVDEIDKDSSYAMHNVTTIEKCTEMRNRLYNLLQEWPLANQKKSKYDFYSLNVLSPERVSYKSRVEEVNS